MSWSEIKKAINSDISKPLNTLIAEKILKVNSNTSKSLDKMLGISFVNSYETSPSGTTISNMNGFVCVYCPNNAGVIGLRIDNSSEMIIAQRDNSTFGTTIIPVVKGKSYKFLDYGTGHGKLYVYQFGGGI